jgi:MFS family permease
MLAAAVVAPSWGKFSDIWGRKVILLIATATFFLGSALSGAAVSMSMLIVGRAVQGVGGGGLLSLVNIVVGDLFSQRWVQHVSISKRGLLTLFPEIVESIMVLSGWYGRWHLH